MKYVSTRSEDTAPVDLAAALKAGLAPDGGLFMPERLPPIDWDALTECATLTETATRVLAPFFEGSELETQLPAICAAALDLPLPVTEFEPDSSWVLELFHGPTAAFKDFAARFLAECLAHLRTETDPVQTVMVATSGDTGAAVAAAFHNRPGFRVIVLYPDGRVSNRQAHQLGAFGGNVVTFRVQGDFDDCQRLVKRALGDRELVGPLGMTSANSISIGRLLPQISYYAHAVTRPALRSHAPVDLIVPTGNLGNALAAIMAREMGLPIGHVHLATNANRTLPEFFAGGEYRSRRGIRTLANAMDVGNPSNFERLAWLYHDRDLRTAGISADSADDEAIRACIRRLHHDSGRITCPHTACAVHVLERQRAAGNRRAVLVAATAHPAKFETVVEPLIGIRVDPPPRLAKLLESSSQAERLEADFGQLQDYLRR